MLSLISLPVRYLASALVVLWLAGCDSASPPVEPTRSAIVGTWGLQTETLDTYATVSQTQRALDPSVPAAGALTISGSLSASVRYLDVRSSTSFGDGSLNGYQFSTIPESTAGAESVRIGITDGGSANVYTYGSDGLQDRSFYLDPYTNPALFSLGPDTVRVSRGRYVEFGSGAVVFAEGTLVLARQTIEAGREQLLGRRAQPRYTAGIVRMFHPDGTYEQQNGASGTVAGTWTETVAGTVVVESNGASQSYHYTVAGSALTMTVSPACDALCLFDVRRFYDLIAGTVVAGRRDYVFGFTRVAG